MYLIPRQAYLPGLYAQQVVDYTGSAHQVNGLFISISELLSFLSWIDHQPLSNFCAVGRRAGARGRELEWQRRDDQKGENQLTD